MKYLLLCLALMACTHVSALVITGGSLDGVAISFEATAAAMRSAKDSGALSQKQVDDWNAFLPKFKASYHIAAELWKSAEVTNDQATVAQVTAIIGTLVGQLDQFTALVLVSQPDGGR